MRRLSSSTASLAHPLSDRTNRKPPKRQPKGILMCRYQNSTMDDDSPSITYSGQWTQITRNGPSGQAANNTVVDQYSGGNGFYNSSASISTAAGSAINLKFQGESRMQGKYQSLTFRPRRIRLRDGRTGWWISGGDDRWCTGADTQHDGEYLCSSSPELNSRTLGRHTRP